MTIRPAVASDVPEIVTMAEAFVSSTEYRTILALDAQKVGELATGLIDSPDGVVLVAQGAGGDLIGMLALCVFEHPMSRERVAGELVWWVSPDRRGRAGGALFVAGERWVRDQGAAVWHMIAPTPEVEAIYAQRGFEKVETAYQRRM